MNDFLLGLGVDWLRPVVAALLLPPALFVVLVLVGARLITRRRLLGWLVVGLSCAGLWLGTTRFAAEGLRQWLLPPVHALSPSAVNELKKAPHTAIVVLGGGARPLAPEYGVADLREFSLDRLRYGLWLARETGLPVLFSGGLGHGARAGATEAEIAARVAERDFGRPLRRIETESRDTRENALRSVPLLRAQGIERIVVVTHAYHMPRSMRNFERAVQVSATTPGRPMQLVAAPMHVPSPNRLRLIDFLPTREGFQDTQLVLHEWVGLLIGA